MFNSNALAPWLLALAWVSLAAGLGSALWMALDILLARRQRMAVMNAVWPLTALYMGPFGLWAYYRFGRVPPPPQQPNTEKKPFWQKVFTGDTHCGAGCAIGDFAGEWIVFLAGSTIAGSVLLANYAADFVFAYVIGIVFQYFAIAPMRGLHGWKGVKAALKADTISLIVFQIGMFAWMYFASAVLFRPRLEPSSPVYWFSMQIAMIVGFLTALPANSWLLHKGWKEAM
jgi:hypothetical protein